MAVRIIFGAPRSGKTYYAVNHLTSTYFDEGPDGLFTLKPKFSNLVIFSNIDSLKLPHKDLSEAIRLSGGPEKFFSYDYQEKVFKKYSQVCYFIDEAQMIFPDNFRDNKVFNWYQYHGHWGQDIYLMTQDIKLLPRQITVLSEITIKALPRSTSVFGGRDLRYNLMLGAGTEVGDKMVLIKKQKIFDLYCSQNSTEANKVRNPFIKYFIVLAVLLVFAGLNFKKLLSGWSSASASSVENISSTASSLSPAPSPGRIVPSSSSLSAPSPPPLVWVPVSYIIQNEAVLVVFNGSLLRLKDIPFEFKPGYLRQLLVHVPIDQIHFFKSDPASTDDDSFSPLPGDAIASGPPDNIDT